jgi:hypothetical protein
VGSWLARAVDRPEARVESGASAAHTLPILPLLLKAAAMGALSSIAAAALLLKAAAIIALSSIAAAASGEAARP